MMDNLKIAKALWDSKAGYEGLIHSFNGEVILNLDMGDGYQGDMLVFYDLGNIDPETRRLAPQRYAILIFGYGSCEVCDALQACESYEDLAELRERLQSQMKTGTQSEIIDWIFSDERDYDWYGAEGTDWQRFRDMVYEYVRDR